MEGFVSSPAPIINYVDATAESVTATLCNLALYSEFKETISRICVPCLTRNIILPYSGIVQRPITLSRSEEMKDCAISSFNHATGTIR